MFIWAVQTSDYLNRNMKKVSYQKLLKDLRTADIYGILESLEKKKKLKVYGTPIDRN